MQQGHIVLFLHLFIVSFYYFLRANFVLSGTVPWAYIKHFSVKA